MRLTGSGKIKKKDETILYSGPEELHQKRVGIILNKEAEKSLIGWKPVTDRIIKVKFQSRHTKTTVVVIYAPTEEAEEEEKDNFYDQCQDVFNDIPKLDMVLILGDMNAQVDSNRQGLEHVIGAHGSVQQTSDNGERLLIFCNSNGICMDNAYFKHKLIHKKTWRSPDGTVENEIDYICINQKSLKTKKLGENSNWRCKIDLVYCNVVLMFKNNGACSKMLSQLQQKRK